MDGLSGTLWIKHLAWGIGIIDDGGEFGFDLANLARNGSDTLVDDG